MLPKILKFFVVIIAILFFTISCAQPSIRKQDAFIARFPAEMTRTEVENILRQDYKVDSFLKETTSDDGTVVVTYQTPINLAGERLFFFRYDINGKLIVVWPIENL